MGSGFQNVARQSLLKAGLPDSVAGQSIDRQCSSGMMAIGMAAKQIISDGMNVAVGGGVESISMNQTGDMFAIPDPDLLANKPELYMAMSRRLKLFESAMALVVKHKTNIRLSLRLVLRQLNRQERLMR